MWTRCGSAKTRAPERRGTPSSGFFTWLVNLLHLDATLSSRLARTRSEPPRTPRRRSGSSASISKAIRSSAAGPKSLGHPGGTSQARSSICPRWAASQIQLLKEAVPDLTRVAVGFDERRSLVPRDRGRRPRRGSDGALAVRPASGRSGVRCEPARSRAVAGTRPAVVAADPGANVPKSPVSR